MPNTRTLTTMNKSNLKKTTYHFRKRTKAQMTRVCSTVNNYSLNSALGYTCHKLNDVATGRTHYCGECNSCEITGKLTGLKQWFDRASHLTLKRLLFGLLDRVNNVKIYAHLNDLLRPLLNSKDFIYSQNKFLPSCDEDHIKVTTNRCVPNEFVERQINDLWLWYASSSSYVKINFMLSLLNKCEQALVVLVVLRLKSTIESYEKQANETTRTSDIKSAFFNEDTESEMICDAFDEEEEDHDELKYLSTLGHDDANRHSGELNKSKHVDFIRLLPVHLSKKILSYLSKKNLYNCLFVCKYWTNLIKEVHKEGFLHKILLDDMMLLKGTSSKGANPRYANNVDVRVPNVLSGTNELIVNPREKEITTTYKSECNWSNAYAGYSTRNVIMEERNVFCGSYNVLLLKEKRDPHRVVHLNGRSTVAFGSFDKKIRFIDLKTATETRTVIQGHVGSIRCIYIYEKKRIVITGSYDTSIRVWSIDTGKCLRIFQGHQQTVTCISMYEPDDRIITGSVDKTCKVWTLGKKKCWRTFKHLYQITSAAIGEETGVSGGQTGKIKVFNLLDGSLIKTISAHQGPINAIKFDRWHILTCSSDCYAQVFSTQGKHKKCLIAMRHPKEVLCLEFQYLRAITGSSDGKIRIWNILTGDCIRVLRGNSRSDSILSMSITENRMLINTENNILLMEFESIKYDYTSSMTIDLNGSIANDLADYTRLGDNEQYERSLLKKRQSKSYSYIRASRSELVATPNKKLFTNIKKPDSMFQQQSQLLQPTADSLGSALEHSARPISSRMLKHANFVHNLTLKQPVQLARNSAGNLSELGLAKRQSMVKAYNTTIQQSRDTLATPYYSPSSSASHQRTKTNFSIYFTSSSSKFITEPNQLSFISSPSGKLVDLNETKQFLREQLKEIKQFEQMEVRTRSASYSDETRSCIEMTTKSHRYLTANNDQSRFKRPTSSPSRVDTKTKIKLNMNKFRSAPSQQQSKVATSAEASMQSLLSGVPQTSTKIISKVFELRETSKPKTNSSMHPVHVKSKMDLNPRIIVKMANNDELCDESKLSKKRTKSAFVSKSNLTQSLKQMRTPTAVDRELVPILFNRPKSNLPMSKHKVKLILDAPGMEQEDKLLPSDNLNLRTFKQVDKLVDQINGYLLESEKSKQLENSQFCRKIWLLKSKGQYHGSLLARPKSVAPEIRE